MIEIIRRRAFLLTVMVAFGCGERRNIVAIELLSLKRGVLTLQLRNGGESVITLVSPGMPSQSVDSLGCSLLVSSEVNASLFMYAFTPALSVMAPGELRRFEIPVGSATSRCGEWNVTARYAYLMGDDVTRFPREPAEDLRRYVLDHQRVVSATRSLKSAEQ